MFCAKLAQVMGDKGFNEKNFKQMKDNMEEEKARRDAEEQEAAAADGGEEPLGGRKDRQKGGECQHDMWALCRCLCSVLRLRMVLSSAALAPALTCRLPS
jgi:hypothetical protein